MSFVYYVLHQPYLGFQPVFLCSSDVVCEGHLLIFLSHAMNISGDLSVALNSDYRSLLDIPPSLSSPGVGSPYSSSVIPPLPTVLEAWHSSGPYLGLSSNSPSLPLAVLLILGLQLPINW